MQLYVGPFVEGVSRAAHEGVSLVRVRAGQVLSIGILDRRHTGLELQIRDTHRRDDR